MIELKECIAKPQGRVVIEFVDDLGNKQVVVNKNLALNALYSHIINCLREGIQIERQIDFISLGIGGHSSGDVDTPIQPEATDVVLEAEIDPPGKKQIVERNSASPYEVEFNTTFFKDEVNNLDITEAGLFLDDNTMVNRVTFPHIVKNSQVIMIVRWYLYYSI